MQAANGQGLPFRLFVPLFLSISFNQSNYDAQATHQLSTTRIVVLKNELKTAQCQQKMKTRIK